MSINAHSILRPLPARIGACVAMVAISLLAAGCSTTDRTPTDTGNMAYPRPLPQGNLSTTRVP